jgi:hypothetical protein
VLSTLALAAIGAAPAALAAPPIAGDDSRSFQTGLGDSSTSGPQAVGALANDSDPDLDFFTVVSVTQPGFGTAGITGKRVGRHLLADTHSWDDLLHLHH